MLSGAETLLKPPQLKPVSACSSIPASQDTNQIVKFLSHLTEVNIYIALQSVLDALDIWLSAIKYVFDALNPSSGNASAAQMYAWLVTSDGLIVFLLGSVFFALFSFCGNYFDSKKKKSESSISYQFSKCADSVWPYVRDCFKGLKWTFKGTRSFILVSQMLFNLNLISYITPFGIGLGLMAALNRGWNRGMVERRKSLQSNNDNFREHVKFINAGFVEVDEKWMTNFPHLSEELKSLYIGSVVKVKREIKTESGELEIKHEYFYVKTPSQESKIFTPQSNQEKYELTPLQQEISEQEFNFLQALHANEISSKTDFYHYKKQLDENNISRDSKLREILRMKQDYLENLTNPESSSFKKFYHYPVFQSDSKKAYASSLLNGVLNSPYYFLGVLSLFLKEISASFFPYAIAICSFFMVLNLVAELYQEFDYQRRLKISENKAKLSMIKRLVSYEWDKINQLIDGSTQNKSAAEFEKIFTQTVITLIAQNKLSLEDLPGELHSKVQLSLMQLDLNTAPRHLPADVLSLEAQAGLINCLKRLSGYSKDFNVYKGYLKNNLVLDKQSTFMQGIKNGLHIYGVFNGCMMAVSTMAFLAGGSLGIAFLYVSIGVGLVLVPLTTLLTVLLSNRNEKDKSSAPQANTVEATGVESNQDMAPALQDFKKEQEHDHVPYWVPDSVLSTLLDERDIRPTKNLMISEQCEVFRQFLSGMKKGVKLLQMVLMLGVGVLDDVAPVFKALYVGIGLIYGALFSLKGLRGLMRVDNQAYEESLLLGGFFSHKKAENKPKALEQAVLPKTPLPAEHFNSALTRRSSLMPSPTPI